MRRLATVLVFAASVSSSKTMSYQIRPEPGTRFALTVEKTGLYSGRKHIFLFEQYEGTLEYDPDAPGRARVELKIAAASLVCKDTWVSESDRKRIEHAALNDMLAAAQHPNLVYTSASVSPKGANSFEIAGTLTIRGIAKPAAVTVTVERNGTELAAVAGRAVVKLKDYGLKPPSVALGAIGTRNEMTLDFVLHPKPRFQTEASR